MVPKELVHSELCLTLASEPGLPCSCEVIGLTQKEVRALVRLLASEYIAHNADYDINMNTIRRLWSVYDKQEELPIGA